jgi:hypothetical protein
MSASRCRCPTSSSQIPVSDPYGEFHIVAGTPPVTMGGEGEGKVRNCYVGFVQLTVWVPANKGIKPATTAGDKFKDMFAQKVGRDLAGQVYRFGANARDHADRQAGMGMLRLPRALPPGGCGRHPSQHLIPPSR